MSAQEKIHEDRQRERCRPLYERHTRLSAMRIFIDRRSGF